MLIEEIIEKYGKDKEHLRKTGYLAALFFQKILPYFDEIKIYNNKEDLALLEAGAKLHDVGIFFEKEYKIPHHKAGAEFIQNNCPNDIKEKDLKVLACLIRYHRKSLPDPKHKIYSSLNEEEKKKVLYLGAIVRLSDGLDTMHLGLVDDFEVEYDKNLNILTLIFTKGIMARKPFVRGILKKEDFFEAVYGAKIKTRTV